MTAMRLLLTCVLASGTAFAQAPSSDPPVAPVPPPPEPEPQPQPQPPRPPQPPVVVPTPIPPTDATALVRPDGFSIGIGVGYRFPTSLQMPNATSVRFRLASGITFEPSLILASSTQTVDVGTPQDSSTTEVGVGALVRFPVVQRRRTDLEVIAAFEVDRLNQDPSDQNIEDQTTVTTISLGYGLAVGVWLAQYLQVSVSATNSLVAYTHRREEQGFEFVTVTNTSTFGLIFDPTVFVMIHLHN